MDNIIVKFKDDLKKYQSTRKRLLKNCEKELELLNKLTTIDVTILEEKDIIDIKELLFITKNLGDINEAIRNLLDKRKRKQNKSKQHIELLRDQLAEFTEIGKQEYVKTQKIINAFENDKIKDPINDIETLFSQMSFTSLNIDEISKIIGMTISFNSQYAKKNKNHQIKNIDAIHQLAKSYYNTDGSFKYNKDILTFEKLIKEVIPHNYPGIEALHRLLSLNELYTTDKIVALLEKNNHIKGDGFQENTQKEIIEEEIDYTISPKEREALQELIKYYKNGFIIEIPKNLEEFYSLLEDTNLDEQEKRYIINLLNNEISERRNKIITKYLSEREQTIYENASELLSQFTYSNSDTYALKQYIEELQTILQFLETESNNDDKEYLLSEIPTIIEQLSMICNRYKVENNQSTNNLIFLLNKNEIPYIINDIDSLDSIYKKSIYSLINKINPDNKSQFRKILSNEPLAYSMYEVISPRAHVAFIEIDCGIYVIMGADIPRSGYKEFNNRLKLNTNTLKKLELLIKNQDTRNQILKDNEEYLAYVTEQDNNQKNNCNQLTLKISG